MYLKLLNCVLKNGQDGKFKVNVFFSKIKEGEWGWEALVYSIPWFCSFPPSFSLRRTVKITITVFLIHV